MITASVNNPALSFLPENIPALRNDTLLPKSPFSCIVTVERGLRICPVRPLFIRTILVTSIMPLPKSPVLPQC
jgi:hypothetical protein